MEQRIPMTIRGLKMLQEELQTLTTKDRVQVIEAIAEARSHGDLSENAEYHAAKEQQGIIEARIIELKDKINRAEVIAIEGSGEKRVRFGATVILYDEDAESSVKYTIVGSDEADIKQNLLPITSPLAKSLIGKAKSDNVEVVTPSGKVRAYEIESVEYKADYVN